MLKPVNQESQIEREIRPLAFCSVVIIFISLVTVHFYRLVLNLDTGFALFCFFDMVEILLFTIFVTMCPGIPDPRCGSDAKWAYFLSGMAPVATVIKKHIYWEIAF